MTAQEIPGEWYRRAFGELYPVLYPHRDDASAGAEAASLLALLAPLPAGARALDVACGTGRHAAALAAAGLRVEAIDLSPALLALAARRPALAGRLVRADMRRLPLRGVYDLVVNLFTSFGYFPRDEENADALGELARALRPGGRLVLDHANRLALETSLVPADAGRRAGLLVHQQRWITAGRVRKDIRVEWPDGRVLDLAEDVRLYTPRELRELVESAGLAFVSIYGAFDGTPWHPMAPRMIVVARRPD